MNWAWASMQQSRQWFFAAATLIMSITLAFAQSSPQDYPQWRGPMRDGAASAFAAPKAWHYGGVCRPTGRNYVKSSIDHRRRRRIMFGGRHSMKVVGLCYVAAWLLLASSVAAQTQASRAKTAASYFARGSEFQEHGEFDRAIAAYDIAIAFDPRFERAYYARARARLVRGEIESALVDFNRAIELDPRHAAVYNDRGYALSEIGEQVAALADFNRALELD